MSHKQSCQASKERKREERSMPKHEVSWKQINNRQNAIRATDLDQKCHSLDGDQTCYSKKITSGTTGIALMHDLCVFHAVLNVTYAAFRLCRAVHIMIHVYK